MPKFTLISHGQYNIIIYRGYDIYTVRKKYSIIRNADFCIIFASKKNCCSFWLDKIAV
nr:MAG TPA: hypothetical protein [Caudoviricetes sp.]